MRQFSLILAIVPQCISNHDAVHFKYIQLYCQLFFNKVRGKNERTINILRIVLWSSEVGGIISGWENEKRLRLIQ